MSDVALSDSASLAAPRGGALRDLLRRPAATAGLAVIALVTLAAACAPLIAGDPDAQNLARVLESPSWAHPLGTDDLGRDVLTRLVYGARISLVVAGLTTIVSFLIATPLALLAAFYGGWADVVVARGVDLMLAFPFVVVALGLASMLPASVLTTALALTFAAVPWLLRILRAEALSLREREFVSGAILDGARDRTILLRYLLPNLFDVLLVQAALLVPFAIIGEALLSFLGVGVPPPTASWGQMLVTAQEYTQDVPWLAIAPGAALTVTALAFNLLSDGLRDVLDPETA